MTLTRVATLASELHSSLANMHGKEAASTRHRSGKQETIGLL